MARQRPFPFALEGGLDLATPPNAIKPGRLIVASNYEPVVTGGYRRLLGYERFDGRPSPSAANYWYVYFDLGSGTEPVAGNTLTGITSANTAEVLSVVTESGTWGVDAAGYIVVTRATGLFTDDEDLEVSATLVAVANGASAQSAATSLEDQETHTRAAREAYRVDIAAVPGSGNIRGVWSHNGVKYAFRDNAGATAGVMYKATSVGWTSVDLGNYIDFTAGTARFKMGETVTGGISGATGVVVSVGVDTGTFGGGNAVGRVYLKTTTGTFQAEAITSTTGTANCSGAHSAVTLPPGGLYEFINQNLGGSLDTFRLYGVNGVGRGFSYDGTDFTFIHSTMPSDIPEHVAHHKKHLFFSFGTSVQHSSIGDAYEWSAVTGAAEIATGDTVTGFAVEQGDVLSIFNRNHTYLLYGTSAAYWNLVLHSDKTGAIERTIQSMGYTVYLDDRGVTNLYAVDAFGDFKAGVLSLYVDKLIQVKKALVSSSVRIREKDQYRLFFTDKSGILAMFDGKGRPSFTPFKFSHPALCTCSVEDSNGVEEVFFGSDDGFVYQMEKGESFDGAVIPYFLRLAFTDLNYSRYKKRVFKAIFDLDADLPPILQYAPQFSYGASDKAITNLETIDDINVGGAYWGSFIWGSFVWGAQPIGQAEAYIDGSGINISMLISGESNYEPVHTLFGVTYHYSARGLRR